ESPYKIVERVAVFYKDSSSGEWDKKIEDRKSKLKAKYEEVNLDIQKDEAEFASELLKTDDAQKKLDRESKHAEISNLRIDIRNAERDLATLNAQKQVLDSSTIKDGNANGKAESGDGKAEIEDSKAEIEDSKSGNEDGKAGNEELFALSEEELKTRIETDERYLAIERRIQRLERNIKALKDAFNSDTHPKILELENTLQLAKADLEKKYEELKQWHLKTDREFKIAASQQSRSALKIEIAHLEKYIALRQDELKTRESDIKGKEEEDFKVGLLKEKLEDRKELAAILQSEINKLDVEKDSKEGESNRVFIYRQATLPTERNMKKKYLLAGGGSFGMFGLMIALVTLLELRFMRISSLKHLENEFHFPVLGTIPNLPARFMTGNDTSGKGEFYRHVFAESVDTTRTMIINLQKQKEFKTLMVTSALGGEGKSTLSCHLAISFARAGRKTLLIDADLRSPRVHEVFELNDFPGMCEAIRNEIPVEKCVVPTGVPRLSLLPAGELDNTTLRLLAEDRVSKLLKELRNEYDIIIIDSAPVLPVNDTLLLLQSVDGIVLSIRKDVTRISKLASALSKIEMLGGNLFGAVVIGIDEADYGYRSKYIRNYQSNMRSQPEEMESAVAGE
ncbi:MAG TPA: polysaccharide biosynthesis tyrosine autokinase, partial [Planctomycetaceae bacterium]|nr:polysaccharide biosynthesis tyrosine autokinase [Planctomycetaceae bacterium]